jgi:hypothetical protein
MTIRVYLNSSYKRADTITLLDTGATENFINPNYARWLRLPVQKLEEPQQVFNVNGTQNKQGQITHFIDLDVQTGSSHWTMRFFLTNLGEQKVILGYPLFAATQPIIDWARGWIAYEQLPVILHVSNATIGDTPTTIQYPARARLMAAEDRQTLVSKLAQALRPQSTTIP